MGGQFLPLPLSLQNKTTACPGWQGFGTRARGRLRVHHLQLKGIKNMRPLCTWESFWAEGLRSWNPFSVSEWNLQRKSTFYSVCITHPGWGSGGWATITSFSFQRWDLRPFLHRHCLRTILSLSILLRAIYLPKKSFNFSISVHKSSFLFPLLL